MIRNRTVLVTSVS